MRTNEEQRRRAVDYALAHLPQGWDVQRLSFEAGLDNKTAKTFLEGTSWPWPATRARIERALGVPVGSLEKAALGWFDKVDEVDPVETAIRASQLNRSNANTLLGIYYKMLDEQPARGASA